MRRTIGAWWMVVLAVGCTTTQSGADAGGADTGTADVGAADVGAADVGAADVGAADVGTDASSASDAGLDAGADAPPSMVSFEIARLIRSDGTPAMGARVCLVGRPIDRCVRASDIGTVAVPLESATDHVLELSLDGYRTFLYPVHAGTTDFRREGDFGFFTTSDDEAYYGPLVPGSGTLTLRAESSPTLAGDGEPGIVFTVAHADPVDAGAASVTVLYATDSAAMLDPSLTETTISGLGGVNPIAPGTYVVGGRDTRTPQRCQLWFGGFETPTGEIAVRVEPDRDVRLELRCW